MCRDHLRASTTTTIIAELCCSAVAAPFAERLSIMRRQPDNPRPFDHRQRQSGAGRHRDIAAEVKLAVGALVDVDVGIDRDCRIDDPTKPAAKWD